MPEEGYLLDVVHRVIDFANRTVERFSDLAPHWPKEAGGKENQLDKILGETSVLMLVVARASDRYPSLRPKIATLGQTLSPLVRSERSRVLLLRSQRSAMTLLMPHILMTLAGHPDASFDRTIDRKRAFQWVGGERIAFRNAETRWLRGLAENAAIDVDDLLPYSVFAGDMNPFEMDRMDVYAITHWLMYASDFGARVAPSAVRLQAAPLLDSAIAWQIAMEDMDLLAELLMGACMLRTAWTWHSAAAWSVLTTTWDQYGFVPSPSFQAENFRSLKNADQEAYAFANTYHTQYVFGMLAALLLQNEAADRDSEAVAADAPEPRGVIEACLKAAARATAFAGESPTNRSGTVSVPVAAPGSCWTLLANLANKGKDEAPFWIKAIATLPEAKRVEVGIDALLVHAVRQYDLDMVAKLVELIVSRSLTPSTVFQQALLWLTRQQTPEGAIGAHFVNSSNIEQPEARLITRLISSLLVSAASYLGLQSLSCKK